MSILCLGTSEDKFGSSQEESEDSLDEDDLSFEDKEGRKFWNIAFCIFHFNFVSLKISAFDV